MRSVQAAKKRSSDVGEFFMRYGAVLEAVARRVHYLAGRGQKYTPTKELARWVAKDLPTLYRQTFGKGGPKPLKEWRVKTMLSNANYLGAFEALDIKAQRGKGMTTVVVARRGRLKLIQGGK